MNLFSGRIFESSWSVCRAWSYVEQSHSWEILESSTIRLPSQTQLLFKYKDTCQKKPVWIDFSSKSYLCICLDIFYWTILIQTQNNSKTGANMGFVCLKIGKHVFWKGHYYLSLFLRILDLLQLSTSSQQISNCVESPITVLNNWTTQANLPFPKSERKNGSLNFSRSCRIANHLPSYVEFFSLMGLKKRITMFFWNYYQKRYAERSSCTWLMLVTAKRAGIPGVWNL